MGTKQRFDPKKAVEAIIYVAQHNADLYAVLKLLYFADKEHLARYGRFIFGDQYVALRHGPVPSGAYDLIQVARGDGWLRCPESVDVAFAIQGNCICPKRPADVRFLSESERECLDVAVQQYGRLSFVQLRKLSHKDPAFLASDQNDLISIEAIAETLPDSSALQDYLRDV